jgi:uncharacterized protein (DUF1330 family)
MLRSALLVTAGMIIGAGAISALYAQSNAPYYEVAEINVTDQPTYEASGVDMVRDAIKASGAKLIAGGYNKTQSYDGAPVANRYLIFQFPSKEVHDKVWNETTKPWVQKVRGNSISTFRVIGAEAVEMK